MKYNGSDVQSCPAKLRVHRKVIICCCYHCRCCYFCFLLSLSNSYFFFFSEKIPHPHQKRHKKTRRPTQGFFLSSFPSPIPSSSLHEGKTLTPCTTTTTNHHHHQEMEGGEARTWETAGETPDTPTSQQPGHEPKRLGIPIPNLLTGIYLCVCVRIKCKTPH